MSKLISTIFPIADFLYLLQLEGYETRRYFVRLKRFFWRRGFQKRGRLVYTKRIKIILALALPFCIIIPPLTPIWVGLSNALLKPYFEWIKKNIQKQAQEEFRKLGKNTKVIMIAGSYGKTTTKNYIYELVRFNYKAQMVPGNINTLTGIANWLNENFDGTSELLIAEVDPYYVGEIKSACEIIPPDIAILTVIGDQHLERLKTKANLKKALLEIFKYAKPDAVKIKQSLAGKASKNKKTNLDYALEVAKVLDIPKDIIEDTVKKLEPPDRRRKLTKLNGFEVVDDSYNISETTAKRGIDYAKKLARKKKMKLVVITAGIPELGEENRNGNKNLGKYLAKKADKIILLKSVFYKDILNVSDKFILADNLEDAWEKLDEFNRSKYLILLQPELSDLYYNS